MDLAYFLLCVPLYEFLCACRSSVSRFRRFIHHCLVQFRQARRHASINPLLLIKREGCSHTKKILQNAPVEFRLIKQSSKYFQRRLVQFRSHCNTLRNTGKVEIKKCHHHPVQFMQVRCHASINAILLIKMEALNQGCPIRFHGGPH